MAKKTSTGTVMTDQWDYAPGEMATITASGFTVGSTVKFKVDHVSGPGRDGIFGTADDKVMHLGGEGHKWWKVTDGGAGDLDGLANGVIVTSWYVNPDDSLNQTFRLTAKGIHGEVARSTFTDAIGNTNKIYQHWADVGVGDWNNNILSDSKSDYFEGEVVPHVFIYKASNSAPLINGQSYSFNITYNHYQQSSNSGGFVYVTTFNESRAPGALNATSPYIAPTMDSSFINGGGMHSGGAFYTVDANITSVSAIATVGGGNIDQKVTVTFTYTGANTTNGIAEIYYGLAIAQPGEVTAGSGPTNGASAWTGGSLQTTVDIGNSGATSIQLAPPALIKGTISGFKFEDVNGNGIWDKATETGLGGWTIYLDTNNNGIRDAGEVSTVTAANGSYSFAVIPDANPALFGIQPYNVKEVQQAGWTQTTQNPALIFISAADPTEFNVNFGNQRQLPSMAIDKAFINVTGGNNNEVADAAGDVLNYTLKVTNTGNVTLTGVMVEDPLTGLIKLISSLGVGASQNYTTSYILTQADLDANGGGDGDIDNTATAYSNEIAPVSDSAQVPLVYSPAITIDKAFVNVTGGNGNEVADAAGDVLNYTVTVTNTGNVTLTGVTVQDPLTGQEIKGLTLDVGASQSYTTSYILTQADLDANGGGDGDIDNSATADSNETDSVIDSAQVPLVYSPSMAIDKAFVNVTGGNGNEVADAAGDVLNYTVTVTNTGNVTLTGVTVQDPLTGLTQLISSLGVGASQNYTTSYILTQADLDANGGGDGDIDNTATAGSNETVPVSDSAQVPLVYSPSMAIDKAFVNVTGGNNNEVADAAGDVLNYTLTVTNTGNVTLTGVTVQDPLTGQEIKGLTLDVGASQSYTTSYILTQADLNTNGGGDGDIDNTATADSNETVPVSDSVQVPLVAVPGGGLIAPTNTTALQYINGTAMSFEDYYASQGGVIQYGVKNGKISQTNPGVFFYFTGDSGQIKGVDANHDAKVDSITIKVDQTDTSVKTGAFLPTFQNILLYKVNDLNLNGIVDAGDSVSSVKLSTSQVQIITDKTATNYGDVFVTFTPDAVGSMYVLSVKYTTSTVVGNAVGTQPASWPTVNYDFDTWVNGSFVETDDGGVNLAPKPVNAMRLDSAAVEDKHVHSIKAAQTKALYKAALNYWSEHGFDVSGLKRGSVEIADLGKDGDRWLLGIEQDGHITIDDDAAGHGWSLGIGKVAHDKVDLLSVLIHEMGHVLGQTDDDMDSSLTIGERELPEVQSDHHALPLPAALLGVIGMTHASYETHFG